MENKEKKKEKKGKKIRRIILIQYQLKLYAQTGKRQPNMSTTFIGKSSPLDEV